MNDAIWMSLRCACNRESFPASSGQEETSTPAHSPSQTASWRRNPQSNMQEWLKNVTVADTSVRTLQDCWQLCLSHPTSRKIIIHAGYFDKLWKKSDSELLRKKKKKKKDPGCFLKNWVIEACYPPPPSPTALSLMPDISMSQPWRKMLLTVCYGIWRECQELFKPDEMHPNGPCRFQPSDLNHHEDPITLIPPQTHFVFFS